MEKTLVTGGTGLVGSALKKLNPDAIYLSSKEYDLTKEDQVIAMYEKYRPEKVIHLAARVGGILDNQRYQAQYFYQNVLLNTYVIHYAQVYGVKRLMGFGSNCAYPDTVSEYPLKEEQLHDGPPAITNFSYALAKRALLTQIQAYRTQYNCDFFALIPCSLYGPHDNFDEENSHFIASLIRKIHQAKSRNMKTIKLFGSGKPLRQFMFSEDLAKIILLLLDKYEGNDPINVGPTDNLSIREIAEIALKATDSEHLKIEFDASSPDGQFRKDLSTEKLTRAIGDVAMTPMEEGLMKTYDWYLNNAKKSGAHKCLKL
ncbi:MAG: GDP-L-fucose synthase [Candidatus Margulisiibacteriota bacterium]